MFSLLAARVAADSVFALLCLCCRAAAKPSLRGGFLEGAAVSCKGHHVYVQHADNRQAAHSVQTALLQGQSGTECAPEPVQAPQPQPQQQQGSPQPMTAEEAWGRVCQKFAGQPPAWARLAFSAWLGQHAALFEEWLATVNGSRASINIGQPLQGCGPCHVSASEDNSALLWHQLHLCAPHAQRWLGIWLGMRHGSQK